MNVTKSSHEKRKWEASSLEKIGVCNTNLYSDYDAQKTSYFQKLTLRF